MLREYLKTIADAIRSKLGTTDKINAQNFADKVSEVYEKGLADEQSDFWSNYADRDSYQFAFAGHGWNNDTFKPKSDIVTSNAYGMFWQSRIQGDLTEILNELGIVLDVSEATSIQYMFNSSQFTRIPVIDASKVAPLSYVFQSTPNLHTIDGLILKSDGSQTFPSTFSGASALTDISNLSGKIGRDIAFSQSPLSVETMKRVINTLVNYVGTTSEGIYKLTFTTDCWTALEADSTAPDGGTWKEYVQSLGWNV